MVNGDVSLVAGKVAGPASRWPGVTDISGSPPTGSNLRTGRSAPPDLPVNLTLSFYLVVMAVTYSHSFSTGDYNSSVLVTGLGTRKLIVGTTSMWTVN